MEKDLDLVSERIRYWKGLHCPDSAVLEDIAVQVERIEQEHKQFQENLSICHMHRRRLKGILDGAHRACDRAGIPGLPNSDMPMLLTCRIGYLQHQREKAERQRDELFDVAKSLDECCQIGDCIDCSEEPGKCSGDRASDAIERLKSAGWRSNSVRNTENL